MPSGRVIGWNDCPVEPQIELYVKYTSWLLLVLRQDLLVDDCKIFGIVGHDMIISGTQLKNFIALDCVIEDKLITGVPLDRHAAANQARKSWRDQRFHR